MTERYEPRVRDEPGQLWGVWDNATETWRETLLGTSEETDARHSAEMLNALPDSYHASIGILISRPPSVHPVLFLLIVNACGICGTQAFFHWGELAALWLAIATVALAAASWKLSQFMRWNPHVIMKRSIEPGDGRE